MNWCVQTALTRRFLPVDVDGLTSPSVFTLCHPPICFHSISLHACSVIRLYLLRGCGDIVVSVCLCSSAVIPFFSSNWKRHQYHMLLWVCLFNIHANISPGLKLCIYHYPLFFWMLGSKLFFWSLVQTQSLKISKCLIFTLCSVLWVQPL